MPSVLIVVVDVERVPLTREVATRQFRIDPKNRNTAVFHATLTAFEGEN